MTSNRSAAQSPTPKRWGTRVRRLRAFLLCTCVTLALPAAPARSAEPPAPASRDLIRQGNEHYAAGRYQEALDCYEQATEALRSDASKSASQLPPDLLHNQAAALFKLGKIDDARALWSSVKDLKGAEFEARSRYNLGNCDYADALASLQQMDAQGAMEHLTDAATQYRDALRLDPTLADARANLELAHLFRKQLEELAQQQPQQQNQQGDDQDQQNQQSCSQPSQSQQDQQSDQNESSQQQDESQSSDESQSQEQQTDEQQQQGQAGEEEEENEQQQDQQAGAQPESMPAESQPAQEQPQAGEEEQPPVNMTPAEAERLLQMVRDAEKKRREMLARQRAARYKPVERDW